MQNPPRLSRLILTSTALPLILSAAPAAAQQAAAPGVVELPAVEVIQAPSVASPVKKKPKPAARSTASAPAAPAPQPAAFDPPAAPALLLGAPGTLIVVDDAFVPVTVATERDVLSEGGANISDAVDQRPGITSSTFAPGASRPIIRGLDSYRVRVQENGIGSHDVSTISEDHAVPIDPFAADQVEVIRGPATLRYGSQAIGGVVAVENQRIPTFMPKHGFSAQLKGDLSSVDEGRNGAFKATAGAAGIVVHADGFNRRAEDYDTPRGRVANSFVEAEGGGAGVSLVGPGGFVGISVSRYQSLYGVPGEEAEEGHDPRIDLEQNKLQARGEWRVGGLGIEAVRFWFGASEYAHDEFHKHHGDEFEIGSRFTNEEQEGRLEVQHQPLSTPLGILTGAIGIQVGNRDTRGQSFEGESLLEPVQTRSLAAFLFEELELSGGLRLQAAARIEQTRVDGRGWSEFVEVAMDEYEPTEFAGERTFVPFSVALGALQSLPMGLVGRLSTQYVERAPDAAELFSKGMHEATGTFEVGNPDMEKEKAFTLEAGIAKAAGPLRFDASAYYTRYQGFIYRQLTDIECEPEADANGLFECEEAGHGHGHDAFDLVFFQQRDATFYGVEIAAQYDVAPIWNGVWGVEGQYDFVHARFDEGGNVPRIPPHRLGGGLFYRDAQWLAKVGMLHAFEQNRIGEGEIATPGYTLVSAEVSYTTPLEVDGLGPQLTIGLKGENLADDEVLNHASFKRREDVLLPGASVKMFGSLKLN